MYIQVTLIPQDEEEQVKEAKKQEMDNNETSDKLRAQKSLSYIHPMIQIFIITVINVDKKTVRSG